MTLTLAMTLAMTLIMTVPPWKVCRRPAPRTLLQDHHHCRLEAQGLPSGGQRTAAPTRHARMRRVLMRIFAPSLCMSRYCSHHVPTAMAMAGWLTHQGASFVL